jgi:hypothetical protein
MIRGMDNGSDLVVKDYAEGDLDEVFNNFFKIV